MIDLKAWKNIGLKNGNNSKQGFSFCLQCLEYDLKNIVAISGSLEPLPEVNHAYVGSKSQLSSSMSKLDFARPQKENQLLKKEHANWHVQHVQIDEFIIH